MFQFQFHNVTYLGEVDIFHTCLKNFFLLKCKNSKKSIEFFQCYDTNVLPPFLWFTVYVQIIQFLSSLHVYSKDAVFPQ